jgi:hypothetical protein
MCSPDGVLVPRGRSSAGACLCLVILCACGPSGERVEAGRIVHAIDAVRDAPNEPVGPRQKLLDLLAREAARGELAVKARDACVKAYRPLLDGNALSEQVRLAMSRPGRDDAKLARDLAQAETLVGQSRAAMPDCEQAAAELRRRFGP